MEGAIVKRSEEQSTAFLTLFVWMGMLNCQWRNCLRRMDFALAVNGLQVCAVADLRSEKLSAECETKI